MGVDANIITCERIREELQKGKNLDSALHAGYSRAFSAIFDGNVTGMIVAIILMGAFGVPDSFWAKALHWLFFAFGATTEGVIYSFGYTLMTGFKTIDAVFVSVQVLPKQEIIWRCKRCRLMQMPSLLSM